MISLPEQPRLARPTTAVRTSYLTGEQADCLLRGTATEWLGPASEDFDSFVAARDHDSVRWEVMSTVFWYVAGEHYIGSLVVRHELTPKLFAEGGHIGYHVVAPWRRQGHATRMLAQGLKEAAARGISRVLLTCDPANEGSRRVIEANGGVPDAQLGSELRYWIDAPDQGRRTP